MPEEVAVEPAAAVLHPHLAVHRPRSSLHLLHRLGQVRIVSEDADLLHHHGLHLLADDPPPWGPLAPSVSRATSARAGSSASPGTAPRSAFFTKSAMCRPARRPNTTRSTRLFVPSRLAPCTDTQAHSPAAYRPS